MYVIPTCLRTFIQPHADSQGVTIGSQKQQATSASIHGLRRRFKQGQIRCLLNLPYSMMQAAEVSNALSSTVVCPLIELCPQGLQ